MLRFEKFNVNPKGRKTGDCVTRALAATLNISWEDALREQFETAVKTKYAIGSKEVFSKILEKYGWVKQKQPRKWDRRKYEVCELDAIFKETKHPVFVSVSNHVTVVMDGKVRDIWDCRDCCVGNYWIHQDDLWRLSAI